MNPSSISFGGKSRLIGIVVFDLKNEYFSELVCALDLCCRNMGYTSVTMFSGKDAQTELDCIKRLVSIGVDGLVLCCVNNSDAVKKVIPKTLPTVTVGKRLDDFPYCGIDDYEAMKATLPKPYRLILLPVHSKSINIVCAIYTNRKPASQ